MPSRGQGPVERVRIGPVWLDAVTFDEALDEIERLAVSGIGGAVFTPNVDHVVVATSALRLCARYMPRR